MTHLPSRRAALGLLATAAGAALPLARTAPARAQLAAPPFGGALPFPGAPSGAPSGGALPADLRFSRIAVDSRPLLAVNPSTAEVVRAELGADLRSVFADRLAGSGARGATLLVRVDSLFLPAWAGGRTGSTGPGPDNIEGVGLVSAGGRVLSETPIYTTVNASYSGAWYLPDIDRRRVASLCYQLAYWLRREMGI